jgi:hypothetical protein
MENPNTTRAPADDDARHRFAMLAKVGTALHGPDWQSPIARDLGVIPRTVRNWVAAKEAPERVPGALLAVLGKKIAERKADVLALQDLQVYLSAVLSEIPELLEPDRGRSG